MCHACGRTLIVFPLELQALIPANLDGAEAAGAGTIVYANEVGDSACPCGWDSALARFVLN